MKAIQISIILFFFLLIEAKAQDTFSIIAVDPATGAVGAAGATCVDGIADFGGIQLLNHIIPGKGGVNAQAWICINPHINLENAVEQMENDLSPEEIITWLLENDDCFAQNYNPEYRQYGIVDLDSLGNPRVAAFTGSQADDYKGHITGYNYAIQGNILIGEEVLTGMENGFVNTEGSLAAKLMGAMQGANIAGADVRCLDRGTSSTSAFLRVVNPNDTFDSPYLELNVIEAEYGEEPIDSLQVLFDIWLGTTSNTEIKNHFITLFPNPVVNELSIALNEQVQINRISIHNINGKLQSEIPFSNTISMNDFPKGLYFINFWKDDTRIAIQKVVKL